MKYDNIQKLINCQFGASKKSVENKMRYIYIYNNQKIKRFSLN